MRVGEKFIEQYVGARLHGMAVSLMLDDAGSRILLIG